MSEIQRADPKTRRSAIIFTLVMVLVLTPILIWLNSYAEFIEDWLAQPGKTVERVKFTIFVLAVVGFFLLLFLAIFTFRFARAILRFDRYPPPNVKVIRDVRVRRGVAARRIGRLMQVYSVVVVLLLVSLILAAWFLIQNADRIVS